ncbi:NAD(P)-dependent oxidoreductase [Paenibacillus sp. NPDC058071]|uniref:NAD(P)-dependent oxidoreductase n=1 Tax=Paenibacillus sp. NPDC058071 TaxID=3346326 RepID=UPI0036D8A42F
MHIAMLGGSGRVGRKWIDYTLQNDLSVAALVRSPEKLAEEQALAPERLTVVEGNALNADDLRRVLSGADTVACAMGTDGGTTLTDCFPLLIGEMKQLGIKRIITIGTAGILESRSEPGLLRYQSSESRRSLTRAAEEHHKAYEQLRDSGLDWTIICPTYLPDGAATGEYRVEPNYLPEGGSRITTGDTAHFAYRLITDKDNPYVGCRVGIAY